jgi:cytochrome b6-f complex iron-sulfur subunit
MSHYQVEPAEKPKALTAQTIKALRHEEVQGISRRRLLRTTIGAGFALWLLEVTAGTLGFLWPNLEGGFGGKVKIGTLDSLKKGNVGLPIAEGYPAYVQEARAYIMLVDPARQEFVAGEDPTGDGTSLNVRALYQRCPHLGCKPNPCIKTYWLECACHGSRYDRLGTKADGLGPAPRGMDRFALVVDVDGVLTLDTGKITLGAMPVALGQPGIEAPRAATGCI